MPSPQNILFALMLLIVNQGASTEKEALSPAGILIENMVLQDLYYGDVPLESLPKAKAYVLYFFSNTCPIARRYTPRIEQLHQRYREAGVYVIGINASPADTLVDVAQYAVDYNVSFPLFNDSEGRAVEQLRITRTPEVVVLDTNFRVQYQGRVDNQYRLGGVRPSVGRHDLRIALEEVLAGQKLTTSRTRAEGCSVTKPLTSPMNPDLTYYDDVRPALEAHCFPCHDGEASDTMPLDDYDSVVQHKDAIRRTISEERMPPWYACLEDDPPLKQGCKLSGRTKLRLLNWLDGTLRKGAPSEKTRRVLPNDHPTDILRPAEIVESNPEQRTVTLRFSPTQKGTQWFTGLTVEQAAGDGTLHFSLVYYLEKNATRDKRHYLAGPLLSGIAYSYPKGTAIARPADTNLFMECHYGAIEKDASIRTTLRVRTASSSPKRLAHCVLLPVGNVGTAEFQLPPEHTLLSLAPYFETRVATEVYGDVGEKSGSSILSVPAYAPRWPITYFPMEDSKKLSGLSALRINVQKRDATTIEATVPVSGALFITYAA